MAIYSDKDYGSIFQMKKMTFVLIRSLRTQPMHICTQHGDRGNFLIKMTRGEGPKLKFLLRVVHQLKILPRADTKISFLAP